MPKFVIERNIPSAGSLRDASGDKIYGVYFAADLVREHAQHGGFPADTVSRILRVIDPTTAEAAGYSAMAHSRAV